MTDYVPPAEIRPRPLPSLNFEIEAWPTGTITYALGRDIAPVGMSKRDRYLAIALLRLSLEVLESADEVDQ